MALSVVVLVGDAQSWLPELIDRAQKLKVNGGFEPGADLGPLISPAAKERVSGLIASADTEGGKILLDGRGLQVPGYPKGNFIGPTVIEAGIQMKCYKYSLIIIFKSTLSLHIGKRSLDRFWSFSRLTRLTMRLN